ncbi:MAG: hypothetical protein ACK58L_00635 [Planctomycetota bacterium]
MKNETHNRNSNFEPASIDDLVRRRLDSDAESISVERLRERVLASLGADESLFAAEPIGITASALPSVPLYRRWLSKSVALIVAMVLLIAAFFAGHFDNEAYADAASVVRAAIETHADPIERVYLVSIRKDGPQLPEFNVIRDVRVHVMGDEFWVEMSRGNRGLVWGRNKQGVVWLVAPSGDAMTIEPQEIGPVLETICTIYSLNTESLLKDVLANCRLERSDASESIHRIVAAPRRASLGSIRSATLDIDRETKAIRRLMINRARSNRWASTVEFTLVGSNVADAGKYSAGGHVSSVAEVISRGSRLDRRRELLANWLGITPDQWILPKSSP